MRRSTIRRATRRCRRRSTRRPPGIHGLSGLSGLRPVPAAKPPGTNGKAIAALVTALAGLMFCGLPSIAGLILGIIAMRECRRTGQDGYGLASGGHHHRRTGGRMLVLYLVFMIGIAASGFQWAP